MNERLLLPIRIPELGPGMGRLTDRPDPVHADPFAPARLRLVTRLLDAAGDARRRAAADERDAALAALAGPVWLDAWEEAVAAVADHLLEDVQSRLDTTARAVGMGRRRRGRLVPTEAERRGIAARLGATGAGLVAALDRLDAAAAVARTATAAERAAMDRWRDALLGAARRLEAAWQTLLDEAARERATWDGEIAAAGGWRPAWWPVLVVGLPLVAAAVWVGLVLGGYIDAPVWFARVWRTVWP